QESKSKESDIDQIIATKVDELELEMLDVNQITTMKYNIAFIESFLKTVKDDYKNCGPQFQTAIKKLAEHYNAAKAKSIPALILFLYNID
ncbi:16487_t:CDS:2, partial [Gigaspora margarita]